MSFQDGFYKVQFATPMGNGSGVAYLANGDLHGGDSMMAYVGKFSVDGDDLTAQVRVFTHTNQAGMQSVLGASAATLSLSGKAQGNIVSLTGAAPQAPNVKLTLKLSPLGG